MTAIATSQIPTSVNSVEKLAAYAALLLSRMNPDLRALEVAGTSQKAVEVTVFPSDEGKYRLAVRLSLELEPDFATDISKAFYLKIKDLSNTPIPAGFVI